MHNDAPAAAIGLADVDLRTQTHSQFLLQGRDLAAAVSALLAFGVVYDIQRFVVLQTDCLLNQLFRVAHAEDLTANAIAEFYLLLLVTQRQ